VAKEQHKTSSVAEKLGKKFSHIPSEDTRRMFLIELTKIRPNPDQPRKTFDEEGLEELAQSIQKHGQLQPIVLKKDNDGKDMYTLAAGERRFRAHQRLGMTHIYAVLTDGSLDEISLIENVQREDLHPLELAEYLDKMMKNHSWSQVELSNVIGKARKTINEVLLLNTLPEAIKEEWRTSATAVPKSVLIQLARIDDPEEQKAFWHQARGGILTVKAARAQRKTGTPKEPISVITHLLTSGKGLARKLGSLTVQDLTADDVYQLFELRKEITDLITELGEKHRKYADGQTPIQE
jgi:ParB family transcriptional regulator, chromosome partitioning protein